MEVRPFVFPCPLRRCKTKYTVACSVIQNALASNTSCGFTHISTAVHAARATYGTDGTTTMTAAAATTTSRAQPSPRYGSRENAITRRDPRGEEANESSIATDKHRVRDGGAISCDSRRTHARHATPDKCHYAAGYRYWRSISRSPPSCGRRRPGRHPRIRDWIFRPIADRRPRSTARQV